MSGEHQPSKYQTIEQLLDANAFDDARRELDLIPASDESFIVLRIKLDLYSGAVEPGVVMQRLIQLMRRDANWPHAKELYQEASNLAYSSRQSSVSHSHPPPPSGPRKPES